MAGGGFAQHAKNVIEGNRALLRSKGRRKRTKDDVYGKVSVTELSFKKSTRRDLDRVRKKMFIQKEKEKRQMFYAILATILLFFVLYLLFVPR
ncbi:MAG: hypothetical protein VX772_09580 [Bacteroidota bacterium]|uniref:Riboflavin synthase subunit beta n=1 Tax=Flagellimonas okinawensis TaxID=3031324 RepID=A0ABT5XIB3_9FLAO|nr:hypothetical protein [[Muricauda] okinawensis]MDF0705601.1 hypothetical protein [[Muricauda] okinawensis]MEC8832599.1 hypothetical protein [Bacteroidota bacterium]